MNLECNMPMGKTYIQSKLETIPENIDRLDWKKYVEIGQRYFRLTEVGALLADATKAEKKLGWTPKITFNELVKIMVDSDMEMLGLEPVGEGKAILEDKFSG